MPRILGLDYGETYIGIAISDGLALLASGLLTLKNKGIKLTIKELKKICQEKNISQIVIGLPLTLSGEEKIQAKKVKNFVEQMRKEINIPIVLEDERLTSIMAGKFLKETKVKAKEKKEKEHILAAQIILQDYLDKK